MDIDHTTESQFEDQSVDDALAPGTANSSRRRAELQQHLADFEATAETNPEPIRSALTYIVSDMIEVTAVLADAVKQALPTTPTRDDVERVEGLLNDLFRANRQVDRYVNLQFRMDEACAREAQASQAKRAEGSMPAARRNAGRNVH